MVDYRKEINELKTRILLWKTRGPVEMRHYIKEHQKRIKEIENGGIPLHGELEDRRSAIKWCQERVLNPALRIKELEDELALLTNVLALRREREAYWLHQMEAAQHKRTELEQQAKKIADWWEHESPGIAGARE